MSVGVANAFYFIPLYCVIFIFRLSRLSYIYSSLFFENEYLT
jgi:hypothetical protein